MHISKLQVRDFRCIRCIDVNAQPGLNFIVGDNASGKSSVLEAIFCLARGRSFRQTAMGGLVRRGADGFSLFARVQQELSPSLRVGIAHRRRETRFRLNGREAASLLEIVAALPVQCLDPNLHQLIEEGPAVRRRYLDWGVFHVEPRFYPAWRRYKRALQQRNTALRSGHTAAAVAVWNSELIAAANEIDSYRHAYVDALAETLRSIVAEVLGETNCALDYQRGWPQAESLAAALSRTGAGDVASGFTHVGPHRCDIRVYLSANKAKGSASRGQQKVLTAAMMLAQAVLLQRMRGMLPILVIDDIAAELGLAYRGKLLQVVNRLGAQAFVSFLDAALVPVELRDRPMFHVEQGALIQPD